MSRFYREVYGVSSLTASAERISAAGAAAPAGHDLVFLAHNGPTGEIKQVKSVVS